VAGELSGAAPVVSVSGDHILYTSGAGAKGWEPLGYSKDGFEFVKIHVVPDNLASRKYHPGKYWVEWFCKSDGLNVKMISAGK
jgi:hypothetical protein